MSAFVLASRPAPAALRGLLLDNAGVLMIAGFFLVGLAAF